MDLNCTCADRAPRSPLHRLGCPRYDADYAAWCDERAIAQDWCQGQRTVLQAATERRNRREYMAAYYRQHRIERRRAA